MRIKETYTAKVLLFGEYSILLGSSALSIPYGHFNASLGFIREDIYTDLELAWESNRSLRELCDSYLSRKEYFNALLDLELFSDEILKRKVEWFCDMCLIVLF